MRKPSKTPSENRLPFWMWFSLGVLGLAAFWPSVWFDFVNLDDRAYIVENDLIKGWSAENLVGIATQPVTRNYAPLTVFSLLIDHSIWGMNPCGYHATNVLLHLLNGMLVLLLVHRVTGSRFVAWTTAALFLVHPLQIETVAWVSSRKGLLSATFMLAALCVRLRTEISGRRDLSYIGLLVAALLCKALAVIVPAIVLLYDTRVLKKKFGDSFARQFIPGLLCLLLLFKTMGAQSSILGGLRGHMDLSLWQILAVDASILWQYVGMLLLPRNLCVFYDPSTELGLSVLVSVVAWALVAFGLYRVRERMPLLAWTAVVALLLMLPVLNLYRITTLMNDRYMYLPCVCFFGVLATVLERVLQTQQLAMPWLSASVKWTSAVAATVCALIATQAYLPVWQNSDTLWNHAMAQAPQLPLVRIQKALTLHDSGQRREGIRELQRALLKTEPDELDRKRIRTMIKEWAEELNTRKVAVR